MKKTLAITFSALFLFLCLFGCKATEQLKETINSTITRGTISGNVYSSEFTGITFTKPDHWRYYTDEEIAQNMDVAMEAMEADKFAQTVAELSTVFDMVAVNEATGQNLNICYENLTLTAGKIISEEEYYEQRKENLTALGYESSSEKEYVTLSGAEYLKVSFTSTNNGIDINSTVYLRLTGKFMTCITVTCPKGIIQQNLEDMFS